MSRPVWTPALAVALSLVPIVSLVGVEAQQKPKKPSGNEMKAILDRDAEVTDIDANQTAPYHLLVNVTSFDRKRRATNGSYEYWRISSNKWREDVTWNGKRSVRIVDGTKLWQLGNDDHKLDTARAKDNLGFWVLMNDSQADQLNHIRTTTLNQQLAWEVEVVIRPFIPYDTSQLPPFVESPLYGRTTYLDASTGLPIRIYTDLESTRSGDYIEFADYVSTGTKMFPREFTRYRKKKPLVELHTKVLEQISSEDDRFLAAPDGAQSSDWCAENFKQAFPVKFGAGRYPYFPPGGAGISDAMAVPVGIITNGLVVFEVGSDGRTENVEAFDYGGPKSLSTKSKSKLMKSVFKPAACGATPVPREFRVQFK